MYYYLGTSSTCSLTHGKATVELSSSTGMLTCQCFCHKSVFVLLTVDNIVFLGKQNKVHLVTLAIALY